MAAPLGQILKAFKAVRLFASNNFGVENYKIIQPRRNFTGKGKDKTYM